MKWSTLFIFGFVSILVFNLVYALPNLTVTSPLNLSWYNSSSVLINVSSSEEGTGSIIPNLDNSLISWWRMDDTNQSIGTYGAKVIDYIGRNNGTANGSAAQVSNGKFGKGFSFDGNMDYVRVVENDILDPAAITISSWAKITSNPTSNGNIVSKDGGNDGYRYRINNDRTVYFIDRGGTNMITTTDTVPLNQWTHILVVGNSSGLYIYLNGNLSISGGSAYGGPNTPSDLTIGTCLSFVEHFNGTIDEVMLFNRSLTASEILSLYNATKLQFTQTGLADGSHTYKSYSSDLAGNIGQSGLIGFIVDTVFPNISFVSPPTPANGTSQSEDSIFVNVSSADTNNISTFIDFDNSLVSWWRMDDVSGSTVYDYTGRNNGTSYGNAVQTAGGKFGKGMVFDGDGDTILLTEPPASSTNIYNGTLSAWIKTSNAGSSWRGIVVKQSAYGMFLDFNILSAYDWSTSTARYSESNLADNKWHHVAITFKSGITNGTIFYVDGNQNLSTNITIYGHDQGVVIASGGNPANGQDFNGTIDDVMIFNRSLSAEEIEALYANQSSRYLTKNFTSLADGTHTFKAYTQDLAGNVNATEMRTVTIDPCFCDGTVNCIIDIEDNCVYTTPVDMHQNNLTVHGMTGTVRGLRYFSNMNTFNLGTPGGTGIYWY